MTQLRRSLAIGLFLPVCALIAGCAAPLYGDNEGDAYWGSLSHHVGYHMRHHW